MDYLIQPDGSGNCCGCPGRADPCSGCIGACCYNDGTCDNLTEADCVVAGGTYRGGDTNCSTAGMCVGVCCEPTCVDNSTPDSCSADGGTWHGFGTTCADDPAPCPTGACCAGDGSCTITSPTGCAGTYQGDGTVCDPNPCEVIPFPPCPCVNMFAPFYNPDDDTYYSSRIDDSCTLTSTYSGAVPATARFQTFTAAMQACDDTASGSSDCVYQINSDTCLNERVSCGGEIFVDLECIVGCDFTCDTQCGEGAPPHVQNTQTLSDQCDPG